MSLREARWRVRWMRIKVFGKQFSHNRAGMLGLIILSLFGLTAIFAYQIAPYNIVKLSSYGAGAPFMPPEWMRIWNPSLSINKLRINSSFTSGQEGWTTGANISGLNSQTSPSMQAGYDPNTGYTTRTGRTIDPGSLELSYNANGTNSSALMVYFQKSFNYEFPHAGGVAFGFDYQVSIVGNYSDAPLADMILIDPAGVSHSLQFQQILGNTGNYYNTNIKSWEVVTLTPSQVSFDPLFLQKAFTESGNYTLRLEMNFPNLSSTDSIRYTLHVDQIRLFTYGEVFGVMGTDNEGRDVWSFLVLGTRISFLVGILATVAAVGLGLMIGLTSGYIGGLADEAIMRATDFVLVLPFLPLLIVLAAILGPSIWNIILLLAILGWPGTARVIRSQVLSVKERTFVEAARSIGASDRYILLRHILPNVLALVFAIAATSVGGAIVTEAALSFLGLGDPTVPSWGQILYNAETYGAGAEIWWMVVPPGLAIAAISISFILIGHAFDEIVNPKLRAR